MSTVVAIVGIALAVTSVALIGPWVVSQDQGPTRRWQAAGYGLGLLPVGLLAIVAAGVLHFLGA